MGIKRHNDSDLNKFDFDQILKPYRSAGTKAKPYRMNVESLAGALVVTNEIPPDIAGAVIFQTCYDIKFNGLKFEGNERYGSKWQELFNHVRNECVKLMKKGAVRKVAVSLLEKSTCTNKCSVRVKTMNNPTRWQRVQIVMRRPSVSALAYVATWVVMGLGYFYVDEIVANLRAIIKWLYTTV